MLIFVIILLVAIITILVLYNMSIHKRIAVFSNVNEKISNLNIVQEFMDVVASEIEVGEKLIKINELLLDKYKFPYSTIVAYNGDKYVIRATNVDKTHWQTLSELNDEAVFKESIQSAKYQYIRVQKEGERLPYQKSEFARAKSAVFFPLYIENIYIGYWIIEGSTADDFEGIDFSVLELIKNNIVSVLRAVENQSIIENLVREDQFTRLKSEEYLYGDAKKIINKYPISTVCMFKITNIEEINFKFGRRIGNEVIGRVSNEIDEEISREYIFVRYMGPKFIIVFSGVEQDSVADFMKRIKFKVENLEFVNEFKNKKQIAKPILNIAITTYYKGVALDVIAKNLEGYLDSAPKGESNINYI
ncbi:MAG: GGDEF domain-containing protein [Clostridia bacterium]|nr:GGDEF domain-containing protein [Clostridia bacterium]